MNQFTILLRKEFLEAWRSFKFLWMPLLFIILGITDPLMNYYLNDILSSVGNMPEGTVIQLPDLQPADILMASTGQFQLIGLAVFAVSVAGMMSRERQNGTVTLLYVRPLSYTALFLSKFIMALFLGCLSAVAGYGASMYYTALLYGSVNAIDFMKMLGTYCLWLLFVTAVCLMFSAMLKTGAAIAISVILFPVGLLLDTMIGQFWHVSPHKLGNYGVMLLTEASPYYGKTLALTCLLALIAIIIGIVFAKRKSITTAI